MRNQKKTQKFLFSFSIDWTSLKKIYILKFQFASKNKNATLTDKRIC